MKNENYDLWSDGYRESVAQFNDMDEYPFAGYARVFGEVYRMVRQSDAKRILDIGFGTGIIAEKLYKDGYQITGVDPSEKMIAAGREVMPDEELLAADYSLGMPIELLDREYDMMISVYAFHRMDPYDQEHLLCDIIRQLAPGGQMIIGGLAFETYEDMKEMQRQNRDAWRYHGMYVLYSELNDIFSHVTWKKISECAGIVTITKE